MILTLETNSHLKSLKELVDFFLNDDFSEGNHCYQRFLARMKVTSEEKTVLNKYFACKEKLDLEQASPEEQSLLESVLLKYSHDRMQKDAEKARFNREGRRLDEEYRQGHREAEKIKPPEK